MEMTTDEIVRSFREAKDRRKQVTILAELNDCSVEEIRSTLVAGGISWRELPRAPRTGKTPNVATTEDPSGARKSPPQTEIAPEDGVCVNADEEVILSALEAYKRQLEQEADTLKKEYEEKQAFISSRMQKVETILQDRGRSHEV